MKKLTKAQLKEHGELATDLKEKAEAFYDAAEEFNQAIANATEFRDGIVAAQDEYIENRSEKWPESEAGEQYIAWKDAWEGLSIEEVPSRDDASAIDPEEFENLPSEPGFE